MIYEILNRDSVEEDLFEGASYYAQISYDLSYRFIDEFHAARKYIAEFPYANDVMYGGNIRLHLLKSFPYHIHYIVDEAEKTVIVLAIVFGRKGDLDFSKRL